MSSGVLKLVFESLTNPPKLIRVWKFDVEFANEHPG